jgi:hypothetical protein
MFEQDLRNAVSATMHHAAEDAARRPPADRPPEPAGVALIIAILPFPAPSIRWGVKHFGDVEAGISTQCIVSNIYTGLKTRHSCCYYISESG